ncbi:nuclear pore membrane glycoprotein 210-like [Protobothrops mucrosquamatus]|uniref:nuclear pore membrane glycoprotein 210-like n=1 Tax=Protobothrops mucrosquamatus TaxID=103944 RepID=UPI000775B723|nr:nuclear pore membrane glycoprotein 210-like [Protobothrops mucrosquamatus]
MRAVFRRARAPPPLFLLAVALLTGPAGAYKLNVPKVLLPFSRDKRVPFVLGAEGGCYSWYSTRHDTVTIDPMYENGTVCSQKALLTTRSLQATKLASVIIAEEIVTGHLLRCDIIVDLIEQVEIVSRTREIYVEDSPLELSVRALDAEGNTFSSLEGLEFEWSVAKDDDMENLELSKKIRILKYSEAEYSPPDYIVQMEKEEKQGDRILVSGIRTGAAVIKVRIQEPVYKKVAAALVRLLVLENIFLIPSYDVFLLVGAYIKYRVGKIVQGKITEVELPLEHYELELQEEVKAPSGFLFLPVAQLDAGTATVTALQLGQVNLAFVHKNVYMRGSLGLPNCTIYVVEPGFLGFTVQPGNRWALEVRRTYTITVDVFDKSSTKVYPSDNLRIAHHFPQEYLEEFTSSANGSHHFVQALEEGVTVIKATLLSVLLQSGLEDYFVSPISHEQEIKIYLPIQLTPSSLAFPYHSLDLLYRYKVQVEGGSGNFTWTSSNQTVATVTIKGVVAAGLAEGQSAVQARDVQNPFHFGEIQVSVLKLSQMEFLPFQADAEIGHVLEVPLAMYHVEKKTGLTTAFTDCSLLALDVGMDKQGVFALSEEGKPKVGATFCSSVQLVAKSLGHTLVTASVAIFEEYFETSATFAAYEPLKAVNPVQVALVTWHSMKEMIFEGGPGPWVLEPSRFFLELKMDDKKKFQVVEVRLPARRKQNQYIYRVTCLELGEQVFTFQVGNHPGVFNPSPAVEMVQVNFICAHPASMAVTPVYKMAAGTPPCPLPQHHKQLVPVSSLRNTILELALFDQHRRKFDNFSSLILEWTSANESLARFTHPRSMQMVDKDDGTGQTRLHGHQLLEVHQIKGTVLIAVSFVKYSERGSPKEVSNSPASAAVELLLVEDVSVVPDNVTMYNHPDVKEIFALVEGSGYFLINSSTEDMANITYRETESAIQVVPVLPGSLALEVYDLCLAFLGPATAYLRVSNMYELEVDLIDKVEIGKSVLVSVRVLGYHRSAFRSKYFAYMHLQLKAASPIVSLTPMEELGDYSEVYMLRAVAVGQTTLVATAWDKMGIKFMSPPRKVEVFPPFRLIPEKMTLIPHNMWQVMSEGGPQPQSLIHFSISNQTVAEVNGLGQVSAKAVGTAFILGTIRAVNEDTGKVIVFSQDQVDLEVVQLRTIRIHAPATRLVTGTEMPVYVVGLTSTLTPFSFGNSRPPLTFHWAVSKRDVVDLLPRHSEISLALPPEGNFAMVLRTRAAGRTSIRVMVSTSDPQAGQLEGNLTQLLDEVQVLVFDKIQLFSPECPMEQILMSMNSQLKLLTNRDGAAFVSTQILQCFPNSSVIEEDGQGLLKAGAVTGTAVLEVTSLELFGVNQTVITGVRVAPVSYLQLSSTPKLYTASRAPLPAFPLGMALTLTVRFFDSAGVKFHAQNTQLHLALNRDDLLLIRPSNQNHTFSAQAVNRGVTLVGVWDERHPGMADYVAIPVDHAIEPGLFAPLAVGDVVCFSTPLVSQEGEAGTWQISPSDVLELDAASGAAFARHPGKATVFHEIPRIVKTYREVVVHGPSRLSLQLGPKTFLTNAGNASEFRVFVSTSGPTTLQGPCSSEQIRAISKQLSPESQLICQVDFKPSILDIPASKIFHIRPAFYADKGLYACLVTVKAQPDEDLLALSTTEGFVDVSAALLSQQTPEAQRITVPFLPAFFLNQTEIVLGSSQMTSEILVLGTRRVTEAIEAHPSSPGVQVDRPLLLPDMPGLVLFPVHVVNLTSLHGRAAPVFVNLSCSLTGQRVAVLVRPQPEQHLGFDLCAEASLVRQLVGSYQVLLFTIFAVLASTMVIFLIYNAFLNRVQMVPVVYVPSASTQDGYLYPPLSAQHHPSSLRNRTQAWLWSVRR